MELSSFQSSSSSLSITVTVIRRAAFASAAHASIYDGSASEPYDRGVSCSPRASPRDDRAGRQTVS